MPMPERVLCLRAGPLGQDHPQESTRVHAEVPVELLFDGAVTPMQPLSKRMQPGAGLRGPDPGPGCWNDGLGLEFHGPTTRASDNLEANSFQLLGATGYPAEIQKFSFSCLSDLQANFT